MNPNDNKSRTEDKNEKIIGAFLPWFYAILVSIGAYFIFMHLYTFNRPPEPTDDRFFLAEKGIIVSMGSEDGLTEDKFHNPTLFHTLLIRSVRDTTLFVEWSVSKEKYYNYHVRDTVKFDYIRRDHWFHINPKNNMQKQDNKM